MQKEHNQTSWKEFIARNSNGVLKSKIELLFPRGPLPAAVIVVTQEVFLNFFPCVQYILKSDLFVYRDILLR